jgi:site-specific DNA recombinase
VKPATRAAWYGRVSSLGQVDHGSSLVTQREQCEAAIKARGWELAGSYVDEGLSGAKDDRPGWQALLSACRAGEVQAVVVASLDRMSRNAGHTLNITDELKQLGVTLVVLREGIDLSTTTGELLRTVLAGVAQMERDLIRERSIAGQRAKSARGLWPGGQPSFGWRLEGEGPTARPVPDPAERRTLELMVTLALAGSTTGQVARELDRLDYPTRSGKPWNPLVVRRILKNPTLTTGLHRWGYVGKVEGRTYKTVVDKRTGNAAHGEPILIDLPEPPLDQLTFDSVQAMLDRVPLAGSKQPKPNQQTQLLTGRIFGPCGRHYLGTVVKGRPTYRPQCQRRPRPGQGPCECRQFSAELLDAAVWAEVVGVLGDRDRLLKLAQEWTRQGTKVTSATGEVERLEAQASKLTRAIDRAKDAAFLEDDPTALLERVARYRSELATVRQRLGSLLVVAPQARQASARLSELAPLAARAVERLQAMGPEQRAELVQLLELRVEVDGPLVDGLPEQVTIHGVLDPRLS